MPSISFADRLREMRETAGLTTYALAKKCGLTKQALYRLEQGNSEPTWQTVQLLAVALGVDCSAFVDPNVTPGEQEPARPRGRPTKTLDADAPDKATAKPEGKAAATTKRPAASAKAAATPEGKKAPKRKPKK